MAQALPLLPSIQEIVLHKYRIVKPNILVSNFLKFSESSLEYKTNLKVLDNIRSFLTQQYQNIISLSIKHLSGISAI